MSFGGDMMKINLSSQRLNMYFINIVKNDYVQK